ncbi:MAG: GAP family protein [Solirubrobacterales bacterium]
MINVLVLAIISAISPAILAVVIVVLSRPNPRRLLLAYLLGGMLASVAIGIAIVSTLNESKLLAGPSPAADPIVNFTVGALALIVAYALATDRDAPLEQRRRQRRASRPPRDPWSERVLNRGNVPIAFAVGITLNLPGAFYLVALKDIAESQNGIGTQVFAILVFNLIMFVLAEVPLLGYSFAPAPTRARVEQLNAWMAHHARQIVVAVATLAGLYLIGRGLLGVL